jgi:hypothetical protein
MDEWDGNWSSWDEWLIERKQKTWAEFEAWLIDRARKREKTRDLYLKKRRRNYAKRALRHQAW